MNKTKILLLSLVTFASSLSYGDPLGLEKTARGIETHDRLIEPTSPILGFELAKELKASDKHPESMYEELIKRKGIQEDIAVSTYVYFKTLAPGLDSFCNSKNFKTLKRSELTEVEHAAIPTQVLKPFHSSYVANLNNALYGNQSIEKIQISGMQIASAFQDMRSNCGTAKKLASIENKLAKFCIGPFDFCENSKRLNHILSSAEVGYPRVQYSLNGYTRFVYNELLKSPNLKDDLRRIYDFEMEWLEKYESNKTGNSSFFGYVADKAISVGMHPNDVFLILGFSMRNMPSLDIEYGKSAKKALLLETYFWSFKKIKRRISKVKDKSLIFPNYPKGGLGVYHYLTAGLLSCQARLSGMGAWISEFLGMFSKLAYKLNKLYKSIDKKKWKKGGISYVKKLAKKQGFGLGVDAGKFGGKFGSKVCGEFYNVQEDLYDEVIDLIRKDYKTNVRKGYKKVNRAGSKTKFRRALSLNDQQLHYEYLSRIEDAVNKFKDQTRSVLND